MCEDCELETVSTDKDNWGEEAFPDAETAMFGDLDDGEDE
ncbi:hypothetical protein SAMN05443661_13330 [Natronobacterium gregoryi]|uniref:Uncharacterized protein n=2 Tax=Natronobacterium gregoryi TaxID=44930 RepID=L0AIN8_NATGS|nr:hypothetical protein Natgr_2601 [Natronobacterium gregoryi SP2]SFJ48412.1 hypothetical protein SAMN05443661_13330 [Natronobacterium gregoryi]